MSTLNDLRANISIHIQTQMDPLRGKYGDDSHRMHCLGAIDGAASSLCLSRGPEHTAMELYRIADGIVMRIPAKEVTLRKETFAQCLLRAFRQYEPVHYYIIGLAMGIAVGFFL